jgi:hypothetical protein
MLWRRHLTRSNHYLIGAKPTPKPVPQGTANVAVGSKADLTDPKFDVRFTSDFVAKILLRYGSQILRAVGAAIE